MRKLALAIALLTTVASAQIPSPNIPITGTLGSGGSYPLLNAGTLVFSSDADHTMVYPEMSAYVIKVISSAPLTAQRNLFAPLGFFSFVIENATTGGQNIQVIGTSGIGVVIPSGRTIFVIGDGTNYVSAGASGSAGVISINGTGGAFTFSGAGVSCTGTACAFSGGSGGSCPIGTCIQNAQSATQTITGASGTSLIYTEASTYNGSLAQEENQFFNYASGWNNGQPFNGLADWLTSANHSVNSMSAAAGISQWTSGPFTHTAAGDSAYLYGYLTSYGQSSNGNDESTTWAVGHSNEIGVFYGPITAGGVGATTISVTGPSCAGSGCTQLAFNSSQFPVQGWMIDSSQGSSPLTIGSYNGVVNKALEYTLSSGTVTPSTAYGTISSCTSTLQGKFNVYGSQVCTVNIISGAFTTSSHAFHNGQFAEEDAVTAVSGSGATQTVTLNSQWPFAPGDLLMQGGPGGESFTATGASLVVPFWVVGAPDSTHLLFSNCVKGSCAANVNIIQPLVPSGNGPILSRSGGTVTASPNPFAIPLLTSLTVGSTVVVAGYTPSDLNGTFTVVTNSLDSFNPLITWAQSGSTETSSIEGSVAPPLPQITLYPSAMICGAGTIGSATLCTNHATWTVSDVAIGGSASEFTNAGLNLYLGQNVPSSPSYPSQGVFVDDQGPSPLTQSYVAQNTSGGGPEQFMFFINGSYDDIFHMTYRPANNGTILYVGGGEPVSSNAKPYYIFQDGANSFSKFIFDPLHSLFSLGGPLTDNGANIFGAGTTVGGQNVCLANGTNCPSGSVAASSASFFPSPPVGSSLFTKIQNLGSGGWTYCGYSCSGGYSGGTGSATFNVASPSLSGNAIEITTNGASGGAGSNAQVYTTLSPTTLAGGVPSGLTNILLVSDLWIPSTSAVPQGIEGPDAVQYDASFQRYPSIQCATNPGSSTPTVPTWNVWNGTAWVPQNISCASYLTNTNVWQETRLIYGINSTTNQLCYQDLMVSGVPIWQHLNLCYTGASGGGTAALKLQVQLDGNSTAGPTNVYWDNFSVATWSDNTTAFTVANLPPAASYTGKQFVVKDATSYTPGTCTGGGSDYVIAISNGSAWSCH